MMCGGQECDMPQGTDGPEETLETPGRLSQAF